jgi:hypothetical protein
LLSVWRYGCVIWRYDQFLGLLGLGACMHQLDHSVIVLGD